ncbi:MAG TPA: carboxypeptidase regulatory-like domain-containing protein [Kofleriaceae bacterium]|nr:carboxypeptidase regulatory-like domain-containing protein [Kofleriaceae bacterium]
MNRKIAAVVGVVVVALVVAGYFIFHVDRGAKPAPKKHVPETATKDSWGNAAKSTEEPKAPSGFAPKWQRDIDPEGPLQLEGQVVDASGAGVGGAEVWLGSVPPRSAKTEDDGSFAFDKLVGREYALTASAGDQVGGPIQYKLTETSDPVVIRMTQGSSLFVTVMDDDNKAVVGADVKAVGETSKAVKTNVEGVVWVKPVHAGWVAVEVTAEGYAPGHGFTQVGAGGAKGRIDLKLHKGVSVSGHVIDDHGKPIEGARITTATLWNMPGSDPVKSDAKGEFTIPALPAGSHTLAASDREHAPGRSAPVTVADKPVTNVEIVMHEGGVLTGTVVDDIGKPVPYATVRVGGDWQQMSTVTSRQTTADKAGSFELRGLDRVKLKARAEGEAAASKVVDVDLATVPKQNVKLVLDVKGTIAGVVVDETGAPIPEVQVNAFPDILSGEAPEAITIAGMSSAATDGAGHFTIRGLPDGGYRVRASRRSSGFDYYEWGQNGVAAKTGDKNVRITLSSPGSIVGKVVVEGGDAPKLGRIQVGYQAPAQVAPDGTFELKEVSAGKHDITVRGANFATFIQHDVEVKPGKPTDVGTITVTRGRRVTGKVVDASGTPVPGAHVKVGQMLVSVQGSEDQMDNVQELYGNKSATTDQDGTFVLVGIPKKATNIMAEHPDKGRSVALAIAEGTDDPPAMTLALRGFGTIVGKVTSQGKPAANVSITDTPKGGGTQMQMTQSDNDGNFTLTKVGEGAHILSAMQQNALSASMKSTSATVNVTAGKTANVTIDIPVGDITLSVVIKALPNNKVDSAQVFLMHGVVAMHDGKQMTDAFLQGGVVGMKFWFGEGKPQPDFTELVPGAYSVCSVPVTGDLNDATFQQRLQEHMADLKVYCKQVTVTPSPNKQTVTQELPAMTPLTTN